MSTDDGPELPRISPIIGRLIEDKMADRLLATPDSVAYRSPSPPGDD